MALTALNWKRLPTQTVGGTGDIDDLLDAIYAALTDTQYYDSSARTAGVGSAWTAARFQDSVTEAVYAAPPTDGMNVNIIFAGHASAKTPVMGSPDTWLADCPLVSITKNSGAFASWDGAEMFTSGDDMGYRKMAPASQTWTHVYVYESQEGLCVVLRNSDDELYPMLGGGIFDVGNTADAETDGRIYGLITQGATNADGLVTSFWSSDSNQTFFHHFNANGNCHLECFTPGSSGTQKGEKHGTKVTINSAQLVTSSGDLVLIPVHISHDSTGYRGRLREIYRCRDAQMLQTITAASSDSAHIISSSFSVDNDAFALGA